MEKGNVYRAAFLAFSVRPAEINLFDNCLKSLGIFFISQFVRLIVVVFFFRCIVRKTFLIGLLLLHLPLNTCEILGGGAVKLDCVMMRKTRKSQ